MNQTYFYADNTLIFCDHCHNINTNQPTELKWLILFSNGQNLSSQQSCMRSIWPLTWPLSLSLSLSLTRSYWHTQGLTHKHSDIGHIFELRLGKKNIIWSLRTQMPFVICLCLSAYRVRKWISVTSGHRRCILMPGCEHLYLKLCFSNCDNPHSICISIV